MSIETAAAQAETILEQVMKIEPTLATVGSVFAGPAAGAVIRAIQPEVLFLVPYLEEALKDVAGGNYSGSIDSLVTMIKHLTKNQPNAAALTPAAQ